jgi:hypothetical protein
MDELQSKTTQGTESGTIVANDTEATTMESDQIDGSNSDATPRNAILETGNNQNRTRPFHINPFVEDGEEYTPGLTIPKEFNFDAMLAFMLNQTNEEQMRRLELLLNNNK